MVELWKAYEFIWILVLAVTSAKNLCAVEYTFISGDWLRLCVCLQWKVEVKSGMMTLLMEDRVAVQGESPPMGSLGTLTKYWSGVPGNGTVPWPINPRTFR